MAGTQQVGGEVGLEVCYAVTHLQEEQTHIPSVSRDACHKTNTPCSWHWVMTGTSPGTQESWRFKKIVTWAAV